MRKIILMIAIMVFLSGCFDSNSSNEIGKNDGLKTIESVEKIIPTEKEEKVVKKTIPAPPLRRKIDKDVEEEEISPDLENFMEVYVTGLSNGELDKVFTEYKNLNPSIKKELNRNLGVDEDVVFDDLSLIMMAVIAKGAAAEVIPKEVSSFEENALEAVEHLISPVMCEFGIKEESLRCSYLNRGPALSLLLEGDADIKIMRLVEGEEIETTVNGEKSAMMGYRLEAIDGNQCKNPVVSGRKNRTEIVTARTVVKNGESFDIIFDCSNSLDKSIKEDDKFSGNVAFWYQRDGNNYEFASIPSGTMD